MSELDRHKVSLSFRSKLSFLTGIVVATVSTGKDKVALVACDRRKSLFGCKAWSVLDAAGSLWNKHKM
jgi:hypothetical protein